MAPGVGALLRFPLDSRGNLLLNEMYSKKDSALTLKVGFSAGAGPPDPPFTSDLAGHVLQMEVGPCQYVVDGQEWAPGWATGGGKMHSVDSLAVLCEVLDVRPTSSGRDAQVEVFGLRRVLMEEDASGVLAVDDDPSASDNAVVYATAEELASELEDLAGPVGRLELFHTTRCMGEFYDFYGGHPPEGRERNYGEHWKGSLMPLVDRIRAVLDRPQDMHELTALMHYVLRWMHLRQTGSIQQLSQPLDGRPLRAVDVAVQVFLDRRSTQGMRFSAAEAHSILMAGSLQDRVTAVLDMVKRLKLGEIDEHLVGLIPDFTTSSSQRVPRGTGHRAGRSRNRFREHPRSHRLDNWARIERELGEYEVVVSNIVAPKGKSKARGGSKSHSEPGENHKEPSGESGSTGRVAKTGLEKFIARVEGRRLPKEVSAVLHEEIVKMGESDKSSSEYAVMRNYVEHLTKMPWDRLARDVKDVNFARQVLDRDHYGLKDVKERILQFIAVSALNGANSIQNALSNLAAAEPKRFRGGVMSELPLEQLSEVYSEANPPNTSMTVFRQDDPVVEDDVEEAGDPGVPSTTAQAPKQPREHRGKILMLVGPPGVGKTSIARSIAEALGRPFCRVSLGGLFDPADLKGHRRTYVGALPGRIVKAIMEAGAMNPVMLLDEIDKMGNTHRGDPSVALVEVLDPEQNRAFTDHYMDLPVDLSQVSFICTANDLDVLSAPLLDRMEIVKVPGYLHREKVNIAKTYMIPRSLKKHGLDESMCKISDGALEELIKKYCREEGVRGLEKKIDRIMRIVAYELVAEATERMPDRKPLLKEILPEAEVVVAAPSLPCPCNVCNPAVQPQEGASSVAEEVSRGGDGVKRERSDFAGPLPSTQEIFLTGQVSEGRLAKRSITLANLRKYVGRERWPPENYFETWDRPGIVPGLAWTPHGGSLLYIESSVVPGDGGEGKAGLKVTGQLGNVMGESAQLAYTLAKSVLRKLQPENAFFRTASVHVHFPEGAVPKDGPSAGSGIVTSLLSLAMDLPTRPWIAISGEVSLVGLVLPVGGIREKVMAAKRNNIKEICLPAANKSTWADLPKEVTENIDVTFAKNYDDVFIFAMGHDWKLRAQCADPGHPPAATTEEDVNSAPPNPAGKQPRA